MTMGALTLGTTLQTFIADDAVELDAKLWVWNRYGTAFRAIYTMYETLICRRQFLCPHRLTCHFGKTSIDISCFFFLAASLGVRGSDLCRELVARRQVCGQPLVLLRR